MHAPTLAAVLAREGSGEEEEGEEREAGWAALCLITSGKVQRTDASIERAREGRLNL